MFYECSTMFNNVLQSLVSGAAIGISTCTISNCRISAQVCKKYPYLHD